MRRRRRGPSTGGGNEGARGGAGWGRPRQGVGSRSRVGEAVGLWSLEPEGSSLGEGELSQWGVGSAAVARFAIWANTTCGLWLSIED